MHDCCTILAYLGFGIDSVTYPKHRPPQTSRLKNHIFRGAKKKNVFNFLSHFLENSKHLKIYSLNNILEM